MPTNEQLQQTQGLMVFLASIAQGLEDVLGRGAGTITYRAGRTVGLKTPVQQKEETDLMRALELVWDEMCRLGIRWAFEPYKKHDRQEAISRVDGRSSLDLVFRHCMVRCSLFRHGHPQKLSLCQMNHGLFCGLLEQIYGARANLEILHAGENACLKQLTVER